MMLNAALVCGVCVAGVFWLDSREGGSAPTPSLAAVEAPTAKATETSGFGTLTIQGERGQFWADGFVEGGRVRFLVDTGATQVALAPSDARAAGIRLRDLDYTLSVQTAGGQARGARVRLDSVSVGSIALRDVDAIVIESGLEVSLLGMSFLGRLQGFEASRDRMVLRL